MQAERSEAVPAGTLPQRRLARSAPAYRWVVLAAGVFAQGAAASVLQGLPSLATTLRAERDLSLAALGLVLAASTVGLLLALVPWGWLADRVGERWVMTWGLLLTAAALVGASRAGSVAVLMVSLLLAGAACASVNAASGRAVIMWFPRRQRGIAMGTRQTAIPLGAALAALGLPVAARAWGLPGAFLSAAVVLVVAAVVVCVFVTDPRSPPDGDEETAGEPAQPAGSSRAVVLLCGVSALLVIPQLTIVSFLVIYLVDGHGISAATAVVLLAVVQLGGGAARIGLGWWSDRTGSRVGPLRAVALVTTGLLLAAAAGELVGGVVAVAALVLAGFAAISWNGLAFTAVGELADPRRIGFVLGVQNTAVAAGMALTPPVMGTVVELSSWAVAFAAVAAAAALASVVLSRLSRVSAVR